MKVPKMVKERILYPDLEDKNWLYEKYFIEKKSLTDIQKIVNCKSSNSIRQALIRHGFQPRNSSNGLTINNEYISLNHEIIEGCLLGDAGLQKYNKYSKLSYPCFYKKNKNLDHIEYIAKYFYKDYSKYIKEEFTPLNGKIFNIFTFYTRATDKLISYYERWYPEENNYKKIVPKDIKLTPIVMLNWFMDDGSTSYRKRLYNGVCQIRHNQIKTTFCTNCFSLEDQCFLRDQINERYNLKCKERKHLNTYVLNIPQSKTKDFFEVIGTVPVESMRYKWKVI